MKINLRICGKNLSAKEICVSAPISPQKVLSGLSYNPINLTNLSQDNNPRMCGRKIVLGVVCCVLEERISAPIFPGKINLRICGIILSAKVICGKIYGKSF